MKDKEWEIYALCDPDTEEKKYIGLSVQTHTRFMQHLCDGRNVCGPSGGRKNWIKGLLDRGSEPVLRIIEKGCIIENVQEREKFWIDFYDPEFNIYCGGALGTIGSYLDPLAEEKILEWADDWFAEHEEYPNLNSGNIPGTNETWYKIESALKNGYKGLPGGSSLAQLLEKERGARNRSNLPDLIKEEILEWANNWFAEHEEYPLRTDGNILGTDETWNRIDSALRNGHRGFPGGSSLAQFLGKERGVRNHRNLPSLTEEKILTWSDDWLTEHEKYPNRDSGNIPGTDETWRRIDNALQSGTRGFPGGSSLPQLLEKERGVKNKSNLPSLTEEKILTWSDDWLTEHRRYPFCTDENIPGTDETWRRIDNALGKGYRGFPGGSSLAQFLKKHGRKNVFKVVYYDARRKKYYSKINIKNKSIYLGCYTKESDAFAVRALAVRMYEDGEREPAAFKQLRKDFQDSLNKES